MFQSRMGLLVKSDHTSQDAPTHVDPRVSGEDASTDWAVVTSGLVKAFDEQRALDGIDLRVSRGTIYGLLGPNGAGKTTLVRLLSTLIRPSAGTAKVLGHDVVAEAHAVRRRISLTGQFASVDEDLSGQENLVLLSRLLGLSKAEAKSRTAQLLAAFGLEDSALREVKTYSGGMRRRLDIAASLVQSPDLLFLDEPTTGLDPRSRSQVWEMIRELVAGGTTVLLTTQYLEEADRLVDRLAVLNHGKVIAEGTSAELKSSVGSGYVHLRVVDPTTLELTATLCKETLGSPVRQGADPRTLVVRAATASEASKLLCRLAAARIELSEFSLGQPSLDEVFFALTGRPAEVTGRDADAEGTT